MGPIFSSSFLMGCENSSGAQSSAQKGQKVGESFCDFLRWLHPQKSPRHFFFMGIKTEVKEMVRGRKLEVVLKNLGFFFGKETLTTAFVPSFYLSLA